MPLPYFSNLAYHTFSPNRFNPSSLETAFLGFAKHRHRNGFGWEGELVSNDEVGKVPRRKESECHSRCHHAFIAGGNCKT